MDTLHIVLACVAALAIAGLVVVFKRDKKDLEIAFHKWASTVATVLSQMGASATFVTPFQDLGAGDDEAAIGSGIHLAEYLKDPANREKEFLLMLVHGLADPVLAPKIKKLAGDVASGADAKTIQADFDDFRASSGFAQLDKANADLEDAVHNIVHSSLHPELSDAIDKLPAGQKFLAPLLVAGKALGLVAAPAVPTSAPSPPNAASTPQPTADGTAPK